MGQLENPKVRQSESFRILSYTFLQLFFSSKSRAVVRVKVKVKVRTLVKMHVAAYTFGLSIIIKPLNYKHATGLKK